MIVHFGLELDGMQPAPPITESGSVTVGPARFLDVLETQLGLPPVMTRPGEALLAYQQCLLELDSEHRFYHRSFEVDRIGVARTLLAWRSQWYEAGWQGSFAPTASKRLADMAEVEQRAARQVPLVSGQRLLRIAAALNDGLSAQIDRIVLHDRLAQLPAAWLPILEHFEVEVAPGVNAAGQGIAGADLRTIQKALLALSEHDEGARHELQALNGDDSFVVVRGVSRDLSAQALGEYLLETGLLDDTVVIAERDGVIVDNALERVGLARAGFQHYSRFRAATQILKLALGLLWEPLSPHLLLQFLLHSVGPLPQRVRHTLADAVAAEPGVGGRAWREAIELIEKRMADRGAAKASIEALLNDTRTWIECDRYASSQGAPIDVVTDRCRRCTAWIAGRLRGVNTESESDLFGAALGQGEALIAALADLKSQGEHAIGRIALERLVDEITGDAPDPGTFAQAGHVRAATNPAAITTAWHTVIWWDLTHQPQRIGYPWPDTELAELAANGVALQPADERVRARARTWLRPILNARSRLIVVIHDRDEGHHPIWNQITSLFEGFTELRVEDALLAGEERRSLPVLGIETMCLDVKPLPTPKRWWTLAKDSGLNPRPRESYSSLHKLIYQPHQWVLRYPAKLQSGRAENVASGNLLNGNLAHRLIENFFVARRDWASLNESSLQSWLAEHLPTLIDREGAVLNGEGMGVVREQVSQTLESALHGLLAHLKQAGIVTVRPECWSEAPFDGIQVQGGIDLLLTDSKGREIVLDSKWAGESRRGAELAENRHLQLATYAYMRKVEADADSWPYQAYFIISTGNVLARDTSVFPNAVAFPSAGGEDVQALWTRMAESARWRWAQLSAGYIEVNVAGTQSTVQSIPPPQGIDTDTNPDKYDDFRWLTGWGDGA